MFIHGREKSSPPSWISEDKCGHCQRELLRSIQTGKAQNREEAALKIDLNQPELGESLLP